MAFGRSPACETAGDQAPGPLTVKHADIPTPCLGGGARTGKIWRPRQAGSPRGDLNHGFRPTTCFSLSERTKDAADGEVTLDWGVNAAVLFGQQSAILHHTVNCCRVDGFQPLQVCEGADQLPMRVFETPDDVNHSRAVTAPNLRGYVGTSMCYHNS